MASSEWIVPLPPGTTHHGRPVVGVIPCHGKTCPEWALVRLDKVGVPYGPCDKALSVRGCKRRYDLLPEDVPPLTREHFESMRPDLDHMPDDIKNYVLKAWGETEETNNESLKKPVPGEDKFEQADGDGPADPAGTTEVESEPDTGTADETGSSGRDDPDSAGPENGTEPAEELGIFGM